MNLTYKNGCLIAALDCGEVSAIGHQSNCFNTMKSGVAKAIVERWPAVAEADQATNKGDPDKLGSLSFTPVFCNDSEIRPVFNLYGQYNYGREEGVVYTDLKALGNALSTMKIFLDTMEIKSVGLPKLGAGLGGARWEDVESAIVTELAGINVTIYCK